MKATWMIALLIASPLFASPAMAASANAAMRQACMSDAKRLCSKHFGDRAAVRKCMRSNRGKLSSGCSAAIGKRRGDAIASCKKRLMPKVRGLGREKARAAIRSCAIAEMGR